MKSKNLEQFKNKLCKVQLKNNNVYTLKIVSILEDDFLAIDKFGKELLISSEDVLVIEKLGGDENERTV